MAELVIKKVTGDSKPITRWQLEGATSMSPGCNTGVAVRQQDQFPFTKYKQISRMLVWFAGKFVSCFASTHLGLYKKYECNKTKSVP